MSRHVLFDRSALRLLPLAERRHDLTADVVMPLAPAPDVSEGLRRAGAALLRAREKGAARILMMGAHVLRKGCQRYLIDLMRRGHVSCLAVNGAGVIHDYELALAGATTESVARYIREGQFGLWRETGGLNDIVAAGAARGLGVGEAVGEALAGSDAPHREISVLAAAWELGVPVTAHVGIGYDIVAEHPNFDGAAWGKASYTDFLVFTAEVQRLEGGVIMNFGSAVMAPEIFLKALAMARNAAAREGKEIRRITSLVCDLRELPADVSAEAPKTSAAYYYRPWKTMLVRTVADGGQALYERGDHALTVPRLWTALREADAGEPECSEAAARPGFAPATARKDTRAACRNMF